MKVSTDVFLLDDIDLQEIFKGYSAQFSDRTFSQFKSRVASQPNQVIRYSRNGEPLWLSDAHQPCSESIPACDYCGSEREFEFQVK